MSDQQEMEEERVDMEEEESNKPTNINKDSKENWWKDYQASTKLRRKHQGRTLALEEDENFDDLLQDLDDIISGSKVQKTSQTCKSISSKINISSQKEENVDLLASAQNNVYSESKSEFIGTVSEFADSSSSNTKASKQERKAEIKDFPLAPVISTISNEDEKEDLKHQKSSDLISISNFDNSETIGISTAIPSNEDISDSLSDTQENNSIDTHKLLESHFQVIDENKCILQEESDKGNLVAATEDRILNTQQKMQDLNSLPDEDINVSQPDVKDNTIQEDKEPVCAQENTKLDLKDREIKQEGNGFDILENIITLATISEKSSSDKDEGNISIQTVNKCQTSSEKSDLDALVEVKTKKETAETDVQASLQDKKSSADAEENYQDLDISEIKVLNERDNLDTDDNGKKLKRDEETKKFHEENDTNISPENIAHKSLPDDNDQMLLSVKPYIQGSKHQEEKGSSIEIHEKNTNGKEIDNYQEIDGLKKPDNGNVDVLVSSCEHSNLQEEKQNTTLEVKNLETLIDADKIPQTDHQDSCLEDDSTCLSLKIDLPNRDEKYSIPAENNESKFESFKEDTIQENSQSPLLIDTQNESQQGEKENLNRTTNSKTSKEQNIGNVKDYAVIPKEENFDNMVIEDKTDKQVHKISKQLQDEEDPNNVTDKEKSFIAQSVQTCILQAEIAELCIMNDPTVPEICSNSNIGQEDNDLCMPTKQDTLIVEGSDSHLQTDKEDVSHHNRNEGKKSAEEKDQESLTNKDKFSSFKVNVKDKSLLEEKENLSKVILNTNKTEKEKEENYIIKEPKEAVDLNSIEMEKANDENVDSKVSLKSGEFTDDKEKEENYYLKQPNVEIEKSKDETNISAQVDNYTNYLENKKESCLQEENKYQSRDRNNPDEFTIDIEVIQPDVDKLKCNQLKESENISNLHNEKVTQPGVDESDSKEKNDLQCNNNSFKDNSSIKNESKSHSSLQINTVKNSTQKDNESHRVNKSIEVETSYNPEETLTSSTKELNDNLKEEHKNLSNSAITMKGIVSNVNKSQHLEGMTSTEGDKNIETLSIMEETLTLPSEENDCLREGGEDLLNLVNTNEGTVSDADQTQHSEGSKLVKLDESDMMPENSNLEGDDTVKVFKETINDALTIEDETGNNIIKISEGRNTVKITPGILADVGADNGSKHDASHINKLEVMENNSQRVDQTDIMQSKRDDKDITIAETIKNHGRNESHLKIKENLDVKSKIILAEKDSKLEVVAEPQKFSSNSEDPVIEDINAGKDKNSGQIEISETCDVEHEMKTCNSKVTLTGSENIKKSESLRDSIMKPSNQINATESPKKMKKKKNNQSSKHMENNSKETINSKTVSNESCKEKSNTDEAKIFDDKINHDHEDITDISSKDLRKVSKVADDAKIRISMSSEGDCTNEKQNITPIYNANSPNREGKNEGKDDIDTHDDSKQCESKVPKSKKTKLNDVNNKYSQTNKDCNREITDKRRKTDNKQHKSKVEAKKQDEFKISEDTSRAKFETDKTNNEVNEKDENESSVDIKLSYAKVVQKDIINIKENKPTSQSSSPVEEKKPESTSGRGSKMEQNAKERKGQSNSPLQVKANKIKSFFKKSKNEDVSKASSKKQDIDTKDSEKPKLQKSEIKVDKEKSTDCSSENTPKARKAKKARNEERSEEVPNVGNLSYANVLKGGEIRIARSNDGFPFKEEQFSTNKSLKTIDDPNDQLKTTKKEINATTVDSSQKLSEDSMDLNVSTKILPALSVEDGHHSDTIAISEPKMLQKGKESKDTTQPMLKKENPVNNKLKQDVTDSTSAESNYTIQKDSGSLTKSCLPSLSEDESTKEKTMNKESFATELHIQPTNHPSENSHNLNSDKISCLQVEELKKEENSNAWGQDDPIQKNKNSKEPSKNVNNFELCKSEDELKQSEVMDDTAKVSDGKVSEDVDTLNSNLEEKQEEFFDTYDIQDPGDKHVINTPSLSPHPDQEKEVFYDATETSVIDEEGLKDDYFVKISEDKNKNTLAQNTPVFCSSNDNEQLLDSSSKVSGNLDELGACKVSDSVEHSVTEKVEPVPNPYVSESLAVAVQTVQSNTDCVDIDSDSVSSGKNTAGTDIPIESDKVIRSDIHTEKDSIGKNDINPDEVNSSSIDALNLVKSEKDKNIKQSKKPLPANVDDDSDKNKIMKDDVESSYKSIDLNKSQEITNIDTSENKMEADNEKDTQTLNKLNVEDMKVQDAISLGDMELCISNINLNIARIYKQSRFNENSNYRKNAEFVINQMSKSPDISTLISKLKQRDLGFFTRNLTDEELNDIFFEEVDEKCLDVDVDTMLENINANILLISKSPEYERSSIIRDNTNYVIGNVINCDDKFQIFKLLKKKNLHSIAFRNVGAKIVRIFSASGKECVEIITSEKHGRKKNTKRAARRDTKSIVDIISSESHQKIPECLEENETPDPTVEVKDESCSDAKIPVTSNMDDNIDKLYSDLNNAAANAVYQKLNTSSVISEKHYVDRFSPPRGEKDEKQSDLDSELDANLCRNNPQDITHDTTDHTGKQKIQEFNEYSKKTKEFPDEPDNAKENKSLDKKKLSIVDKHIDGGTFLQSSKSDVNSAVSIPNKESIDKDQDKTESLNMSKEVVDIYSVELESKRNELEVCQKNESISESPVSSLCFEKSAVSSEVNSVAHIASASDQHHLNKENCEIILDNIKNNIQSIIDLAEFKNNSECKLLVKSVLNILASSRDVIHVIERLKEMELQDLTDKIENVSELLIKKDITPLPIEKNENNSIIEIIKNNVDKYIDGQQYQSNETLQRKVKTVLSILDESNSPDDVLDKLQLEGLHHFAVETKKEPSKSEGKVNKTEILTNIQDTSTDKSIVGKILSEVSKSPKTQKDAKTTTSSSMGDVKLISEDQSLENTPPDSRRIDRNKESRKVKRFSRVSIVASVENQLQEEQPKSFVDLKTDLDKDDNQGKASKSEFRTVVKNDNMHSNMEYSLQRSFTEVLKENDEKKSSGKRKKSQILDENSIVSRVLREKKEVTSAKDSTNSAECLKVSSDKNDLELSESKNVMTDAEHQKFPNQTPENKQLRSLNEHERIRTESVSSDTIPDLCPVDDIKPDENCSLPGIFVTIPESNEKIIDEHSKNVNLFFLTSFDDGSECSDESIVTSGPLTPNVSNMNPTNDEIVLEDKLLEEFDNFLQSSSIDSAAIENKRRFVKKTIELVSNDLQQNPCDKTNSCCVISKIDTSHESDNEADNEDVYDVFDASMKRLEFIETQFRGIYSEPPEDNIPSIDACPPIEHNVAKAETCNETNDSQKLKGISNVLNTNLSAEEMIASIRAIMDDKSPGD